MRFKLPSYNDSACTLRLLDDDGRMKSLLTLFLVLFCVHLTQADDQERNAALEKMLSGSKFIGVFTIDGQEGVPAKEEYTIKSVKKLTKGDIWIFQARIKYGKQDVTLPVPVPIKWAGKTPVIEMDSLKIPLLGTFSAHIVIDDGKYAGTWKHGKVGGHMFGEIKKVKNLSKD